MKHFSLWAVMGILVLSGIGCAAGSATAGYSMQAKTADEVSPMARQRIIDEAVAQSKAHTDLQIARLRAELGRP